MTMIVQVCGVLVVLAVPYAAITYADHLDQQRRRNEQRFNERKDAMLARLTREKQA